MDTLRLLGILTLCSCALAGIRILDLDVPAQLQHGKLDTVTLDCKYEVDTISDTEGLVVQWFFKDKEMVYQWFPGKAPTPLGILKDRLDLKHVASNDENHKHRALKIINITTDLSGEYKCKVANYEVEASESKTMVIYEPPKVFYFENFENTSRLLCSAFDMFPKPTLTVYSNNVNLTEVLDDEEDNNGNDNEEDDIFANEVYGDEDEVEDAYGFYNVTKGFRYEPSEITEEIEFICELTIPNTDYQRILRKFITPEGERTSTTESYDYETTTMTTTYSPVITENFAFTPRSSTKFLFMIAFVYVWRHL